MKKLPKKNFLISIIIAIVFVIISVPFWIYLKVLPYAVSNEKVLTVVQQKLKESLNTDLTIKNPVLITGINSDVSFKADEISIEKEKKQILLLKKLDATISLKKIVQKTIILKKFELDSVFVDTNQLVALGKKEEKKEKAEFDWNIEWFDSLLSVKNLVALYDAGNDTNIKTVGKNLEITETRNPKFVHFDMNIDIQKGKEKLALAISDKDNVYIKNKKMYIDNAVLGINNSKVFVNAVSDEKSRFNLDVYSHNFDVKNVIEIIETNLIIPDGDKMLAFYKDIKGLFNFKINLTNQTMNGFVDVKNVSLKLVPLNNLPIFINKGKVDIDTEKITLKDFSGYYGGTKNNSYKLDGDIKDYTKSVDINIEATGKITNDFMKNYLSPIVGTSLTLTGTSGAKAIIKSKYNKYDITLMAKVPKGYDILVDGMSMSPVDYDRAVAAYMNLDGNELDIKSINYYIAQEITKNSKGIKPILTIDGNVNIATAEIKKLGFNIPKPLPSEFLNVLIGQKLFKRGTISGNMHMVNENKVPKLNGTMKMEKVFIPSQRLSIQEGVLTTNKNTVDIDAHGRFKRSKWKFNGGIENKLLLPIVVKDIYLNLDKLDVEKLLLSMSKQPAETDAEPTLISAIATEDTESDSDEALYVFNKGFLIVEKCLFELDNGNYKEINFANLKADLTLNKDGVLDVKSNKFDFADGISTLKVYCDLIKHQYSIRLGVKDIDSDLIASNVLGLPKEISGRARGLIELYTDDTMKLNGRMQFDINDGTIQKVGLVEYALKFASLFRNPMTMISPSTIIDLVNVPDGRFNWIKGDIHIKDNVAKRIMIKSAAPHLSSFIIGSYNLENSDAALRIYTKFSDKYKGLRGVLRNISLNSLANKVSLGSANESLYYSAELSQLPEIDAPEKDCQVFLTKVDGDVEHFNFLSSLKKIK